LQKSKGGTFYVARCRDLIYDVGLHKSEDAEFYLRKGFRVVGFEADPDLVAFCRERLKAFIDGGQLMLVEGASVDPSREGKFVAQRFEEGCSGLFGSELGREWKFRRGVLRQYYLARLDYLLLGDDGVMTSWTFRGANRLRSLARRAVGFFRHAAVPGRYDTHARHSCADDIDVPYAMPLDIAPGHPTPNEFS
jgi:hypothetical protein